jgi:hypothetical protein
MTDRPRFLITLEPLADTDDRPPWYRLKLLLKTALRRDKLRAVAIEEIKPTTRPADGWVDPDAPERP